MITADNTTTRCASVGRAFRNNQMLILLYFIATFQIITTALMATAVSHVSEIELLIEQNTDPINRKIDRTVRDIDRVLHRVEGVVDDIQDDVHTAIYSLEDDMRAVAEYGEFFNATIREMHDEIELAGDTLTRIQPMLDATEQLMGVAETQLQEIRDDITYIRGRV